MNESLKRELDPLQQISKDDLKQLEKIIKTENQLSMTYLKATLLSQEGIKFDKDSNFDGMEITKDLKKGPFWFQQKYKDDIARGLEIEESLVKS